MIAASWCVIGFLGLISLSTLAMAVAMLIMANDVHRTLRTVQGPLNEAHQILATVNRSTRGVAALVDRISEAIATSLQGLNRVKEQVQLFVGAHGNGARGGPRPHHRRARSS